MFENDVARKSMVAWWEYQRRFFHRRDFVDETENVDNERKRKRQSQSHREQVSRTSEIETLDFTVLGRSFERERVSFGSSNHQRRVNFKRLRTHVAFARQSTSETRTSD